jgi:proline iminopeptidase
VVLTVTVAVLVGVAALLGAAAVSPDPRVFVTAGVLAFLLADAVGAVLVARRAPSARRRTARNALVAASVVLVLGLFAVATLGPAPAPTPRTTLPGEQLVDLPTGSRLLVAHLPARGAPTRPPVVVLHGGPGVPDLKANAQVLGALTEIGADVVLYAQVGTDRSTRLDDPVGYGPERDVRDLEALRARLGLDRMVLVGHSYGGALAAAYLAAHPDRVERMVLVSPGPLDPADTSENGATAGLDAGRKARLYAEPLGPRDLLGYALLQVNPLAAHAFLPDTAADARNDSVLTIAEPALFCPGDVPADLPPVRGSGFYAMQYPQSATAPPPADVRPALTGLSTPTLILKGRCDYLSWRSAVEYRRLLPGSVLGYVPDAGHNLHQERPEVVRDAIAAFLDGRPPASGLVRDDLAVPDGYLGAP